MNQRLRCAIYSCLLFVQVSGRLHHWQKNHQHQHGEAAGPSPQTNDDVLQAQRLPEYLDVRSSSEKANHHKSHARHHAERKLASLPVEAPGAPAAYADFHDAFKQEPHSYAAVPGRSSLGMTVDASATTDAAALEHELVKPGAFCVNRASDSSHSVNVGANNVMGCVAHVRSAPGCGQYFDFGLEDGWCDCVRPEAGECRLGELTTYNVYKLKNAQPRMHVATGPRPALLSHKSKDSLKAEHRRHHRRQMPGNSTNKTVLWEGVPRNAEGDLQIFAVAFGFNVVVVIICFLVFSCCRSSNPLVYNGNLALGQAPVAPSTSFCGWIGDSMKMRTDDVARFIGLDAAMMLEYNTLAFTLLLIIGIPLNLILVPMHIFAGGGAAGDDRLSWQGIANISADGGNLYWVHSFIVWAVAIITQFMIFRAMRGFMGRRWTWIKEMPAPRNNTVMVENMPRTLSSTTHMKEYFNKAFGRQVVAGCTIVKYTRDLRLHLDNMNAYQKDLLQAEQRYKKTGKRPQLKSTWGETHDAIEYFKEKIQEFLPKINDERARIIGLAAGRNSETVCSASGFVTFRTHEDAMIATTLNYGQDGDLSVIPAPEPSDVIWSDLMISKERRRDLIGGFWLAFFFILWLPLVGLIAYCADLKSLENIPGLSFTYQVPGLVARAPWVATAWNAVAGPLLLTFAMSLWPTLLAFTFNGWFVMRAKTFSQHLVQRWYFNLSIVFVLIVAAVGKLMRDAANESLEKPLAILDMFGSTLPLVSHFYLSYIMLQWSVYAVDFTRWTNLLYFSFYRIWYEDTFAKLKSEPEDPDWNGIGCRSARSTMCFVIVLVFCQISPIICLLGLVLFASLRVYYGYLLVFSEAKKPDLGGVFWVTQLRHTQLGVFLYILLMTAILYQRSPDSLPATIAACSLVPMIFAYVKFDQKFKWELMPVEGIIEEARSKQTADFHVYEQPEMRDRLPDFRGLDRQLQGREKMRKDTDGDAPRSQNMMSALSCGACGTSQSMRDERSPREGTSAFKTTPPETAEQQFHTVPPSATRGSASPGAARSSIFSGHSGKAFHSTQGVA